MNNNNTLHYTRSGKGKTVVLLHGYCEDLSIWDKTTTFLSSSFDVVCIDLPGFGKSKGLENTTIEQMAIAVFETLDVLGVYNSVMIGHSLGGYVALAFAELYPASLSGLGLFHSTAYADNDQRKEARNKTVDFIQRKGVATFAMAFVEPLFFMRNRKRLVHEIANLKEVAANTAETSVCKTAIAMRDRPDRTHVLHEVKIPYLFIVGKEDHAVTLESSLDQCAIPDNSTVRFLGDVGHMGMFEAANECHQTIKSFLNNCYYEN